MYPCNNGEVTLFKEGNSIVPETECDLDRLRDACGVFGIFGDPEAAQKTYLGLYALQHRGQESAGIAASDGKNIALHKGMGLVRAVFSHAEIMAGLPGTSAIGHNRYSTTGGSGLINAQPILIQFKKGQIAAAHNGNLINALALRKRMEGTGSIFQTTSDSEVVLHLIARSEKNTIEDMVIDALGQLEGAYCFLFLTPTKLIAARDPYGFRPLCVGTLGDTTVVASESCALDIIGARYIRSVEPGEVISIDAQGMTSRRLPDAPRKAFCIFEYIYFSRPDSIIFGNKVDKFRRRLGKKLAEESPCDADIVMSVPDSANTAALGYAQRSGIRFEIGLIRNHYIGRTFIDPYQDKRVRDVRIKFNPVTGVLEGRRVVVVDDSIVRGTTMKQLVRLIRAGGAAAVHVRVASPPVRCPCFYGIDIPSSKELIASTHSIEETCRYIEADSLAYLSVQEMLKAVPDGTMQCTACFTGDYPTAIPKGFSKEQFSIER
ncbi:MAG: amidophosphoribosyltransferase [Deltaproteobacteria bacterium]|nr:amidophosphoribosyltransferase [Deltaproteobacteria bacterium]